MEAPDAIVVLAGGIKQVGSRWVSTDFTAEDDRLGAPGAALRAPAAAVLAARYPGASVIANGGKGYDVPEGTPEDRPLLAEILRDELIECGVPIARIVLMKKHSNTTYQGLQELGTAIEERHWRNVLVVTNRYHIPRLRLMLESKFPAHIDFITLVSAEEVLIEVDAARWKALLEEVYASPFMAERIAKEQRGIAQIQEGTYRFI